MSKVDEELRRALDESEAQADEAVSSALVEPEPESESKRSLGLLIGLLAMAGAVLAFVLGGDNDNMIYSKQVDDVLVAWDDLAERNLRVQGVLVHGTLVKRDSPCEYRFKMKNKTGPAEGEMEVRYGSCIVPDTFRDVKGMDVEVTAEGQLEDGYLQAKHIFAKCPSKYEMQQRKNSGEAAPHAIGPAMGEGTGTPSAGLPTGSEG